MAWLPAFKYIKGLFARGGGFLQGNGEPYEGPYHKLYTGETFSGATPSNDSFRIYEDDSEPHLTEPLYEDKLVTEQAFPAPEAYDKGFFIRYFIKDKRVGKIVEVVKSTYDKKVVEKYLLGTTVKWIITKPIKDIFNQGFLYKGSMSRNKENTLKASYIMKGLVEFITEYDKFANVKSDVKGYKFEELPKEEKLRIILKQSPLRKPPKLKYPHLMYNPKNGDVIKVGTMEEHSEYVELGWVHDKPRFIKKIKRKRLGRPTVPPVNTNTPSSSGGGGGGGGSFGGGNYTQEIADAEQMNGGMGNNNNSNNNPSQNNYY